MTEAEPESEHAGRRELAGRARAAFAITARAQPGLTAGSAATALVAGLAPVVAAWLAKLVLDRLTVRPVPTAEIVALAVGLGVAGLVTAVAPHVSSYLGAQLRRRLQVETQDRLFRAVTGWPGLARFENPQFYDRLRLGQQAGEAAPQQVVGAVLVAGQSAVTFVGFLVTLWALSPEVSAIVLLAALPAVRVQLALSRSRAAVQWWNSPGTRRVQFYSNLLSGVGAAKEIRLFGLGPHLHARMLDELDDVNAAQRRVDLEVLKGNAWLAVLGAVVAAGGLVWTVLGAAAGRFTVGDVSVFVAALAGTQAALASIVQRYADLHSFLLTFGHFLTVTRADAGLPVRAEPRPVPPLRDGIELRDVWFRYDDHLPWVLRGVDLRVQAGRSLGLVGLNGAGKTTIVKLLCRFYDPARGSILWDGVDLRDLEPAALRERISAVFQDFVCYELTAADNIGFGDVRRLSDRAGIEAAASVAGVAGAMAELPRGYDTMLSRAHLARRGGADQERGTLLSGGQWQRVALARGAFRADRDLLVLDEPSSGLDPEAEHELHRRLQAGVPGSTRLLVTHRLGAMRDADEIAVLADGRITERGTHASLIATGGEYARLFDLQASSYAPGGVPEPR